MLPTTFSQSLPKSPVVSVPLSIAILSLIISVAAALVAPEEASFPVLTHRNLVRSQVLLYHELPVSQC